MLSKVVHYIMCVSVKLFTLFVCVFQCCCSLYTCICVQVFVSVNLFTIFVGVIMCFSEDVIILCACFSDGSDDYRYSRTRDYGSSRDYERYSTGH